MTTVGHTISINADGKQLEGDLHLPPDPQRGICVFAHGSGSSRFSSRNQYVASVLHKNGIGTLLMDLLTKDEERVDNYTRHLRFDIPMLTRRVVAAIDHLAQDESTKDYPVGTFGASTGGAAALWAAYHRPDRVKCAISRGGRPDLVPKEVLSHITTPTFLIVGGLDYDVIEMNKEAFEAIPSTTVKKLDIVPGATHLFEEPGTLEKVAELAAGYLKQYLQKKEE
ncbi:uncharacterized protein SPPG_01659 [Spizellomyces punctatus DAOM BR117]|uniref:Dienelactone hydrolase domain-containing protein n=1 Tax=Spizellomyces punctatus (strain DAOM BR117) TaxID=645134 RepID=A0A0L0HSZ2_SPIPD|nr:uncharacterized protein SPPG_01659 [Spizellomyces punctatus DAOM BR117]KND04228.1 hypothetical protein SPPG_01659 [Spizellomyces punctatus DAOM BR117]|eukprot:XP_016612267.1 hypothetical protein SPPG_01659 [Spizellomyces punctatus DAOM BR117]